MALPRELVRFAGPFTGLNTRDAPSDLGLGEAQIADNMVLVAGRPFPHPPLVEYLHTDAPVSAVDNINGKLISMVQIHTGSLQHLHSGNYPSGLVVIGKVINEQGDPSNRVGYVILNQQNVLSASIPAPVTLTEWRAQFVVANRIVYCLDGSSPGVKTDGSTDGWFPVGMLPPVVDYHIQGTSIDPSADFGMEYAYLNEGLTITPPAAGTYDYAVTWFDPVHGVESNPTIFRTLLSGPDTVRISKTNLTPPSRAHTRFRVYRRDVTNQTPGYLVHEGATAGIGGNTEQFIDGWENNVATGPAGTLDAGPYIPSRNGLPPKATIGAWYKGRMFYNDHDDGSRVWFSELDSPDHVADDNFLTIGGDPEDQITGMAEVDGQLIIQKLSSVHVVSGAIAFHTNATIERGELPFLALPEQYQSKASRGCHNRFGNNGAVVCGSPPALHYTHSSGLVKFTGAMDVLVGSKIRPTWHESQVSQTAAWPGHFAQFAVDADWGNLYVLIASGVSSVKPTQLFVYNWAVGGWTIFKPDEQDGVFCDGTTTYITALCSAIGLPDYREISSGNYKDHPGEPCPFLLSIYSEQTGQSKLFYCTRERDDVVMPLWKWRTGELPIGAGSDATCHYLKWIHGDRNSAVDAKHQYGKVNISIDGKADQLLSLANGTGQLDLDGLAQTLNVGRIGARLELEFSGWNQTSLGTYIRKRTRGLSGFTLDVEFADVR